MKMRKPPLGGEHVSRLNAGGAGLISTGIAQVGRAALTETRSTTSWQDGVSSFGCSYNDGTS